jgi:hypothetical protein
MSNDDYEVAGESEGHEHEADTLEAPPEVSLIEIQVPEGLEVSEVSEPELLGRFVDYLRMQSIVLAVARVTQHHHTEYVPFRGDLNATITAFLAGR